MISNNVNQLTNERRPNQSLKLTEITACFFAARRRVHQKTKHYAVDDNPTLHHSRDELRQSNDTLPQLPKGSLWERDPFGISSGPLGGQLSYKLTIFWETEEDCMQRNLSNEIQKLSIPERILLVEDIWDSIARENEAFELLKAQKNELDKRSQSFKKNPTQGRSWQEIKSEFLKAK